MLFEGKTDFWWNFVQKCSKFYIFETRLYLSVLSKDHSSLCDGCIVTECAAGNLRGPSVFKTLCVHFLRYNMWRKIFHDRAYTNENKYYFIEKSNALIYPDFIGKNKSKFFVRQDVRRNRVNIFVLFGNYYSRLIIELFFDFSDL